MTSKTDKEELDEFTVQAGVLAGKIIAMSMEAPLGPLDCAFVLGLVLKGYAQIIINEDDEKQDVKTIQQDLMKSFLYAVDSQGVEIQMIRLANQPKDKSTH